MLKAALAFLALATGSFVAVKSGEGIYSAFQFQIPQDTALKTTPDAANIWSWHKTIPLTGSPTVQQVVVDFDNNGRMDSEYPFLRVLITDLQVTLGEDILNSGVLGVWLTTGNQKRWRMFDRRNQGGTAPPMEHHLTTPIMVPVDSDLKIEITYQSSPNPVTVNLLGRVVSL